MEGRGSFRVLSRISSRHLEFLISVRPETGIGMVCQIIPFSFLRNGRSAAVPDVINHDLLFVRPWSQSSSDTLQRCDLGHAPAGQNQCVYLRNVDPFTKEWRSHEKGSSG